MANYLKRAFVCDRLRISRCQSYEMVGSSYGPRISSDDVLAVLNRARRGMPDAVEWIPHDLLNWTRRTKAVPPHYRLTKRTIRFPRAPFMAWLDARSRIKSLKVRVA